MTAFDFALENWPLVAAFGGLIVAYFVVNSAAGGKSISVHEVTRLVNQGNALLLDVREANEFKAGHITGAINIPFGAVSARVEELEKHRGKHIILVDKIGQHAGEVAKQLKAQGFDVVRLGGGMSEWTHQSLPVVKK
ncbi:MAG TPA: rhodanese-like domain-containing protein [Cellvibrionaceae bacterium]|nr:rhodanese-like domain-containing protein [Cellvibrionaceae bacterium]